MGGGAVASISRAFFAGKLFGANFCNAVDFDFGFFCDLTTFDFTLDFTFETDFTLLT